MAGIRHLPGFRGAPRPDDADEFVLAAEPLLAPLQIMRQYVCFVDEWSDYREAYSVLNGQGAVFP